MYPMNQDAPDPRGYATNAINSSVLQGQERQTAPPPPSGIASRIQDLQGVVSTTRELAYNLRCALGIQQPTTEGKPMPAASTLAEVITEARMALIRANDDFRDVLQHLNS